jgi:hypothetical protein
MLNTHAIESALAFYLVGKGRDKGECAISRYFVININEKLDRLPDAIEQNARRALGRAYLAGYCACRNETSWFCFIID